MAYFLLKKSKVLDQYNELRKHADIVGYNFKTNPTVGKIIESETNAPIVISSEKSEEMISEKNRIIYILQGESANEVKKLYDKGVQKFIVDNENDLRKVIDIGNDVDILLRMKVKEHTVYTGKYFVYGIQWNRINELIPSLRKNENVRTLGVHFHRKTQNVGEWSLKDEFEDSIGEALDDIDIVMIGGGIPVKYANSKPDTRSIFRRIDEFHDFLKDRKIKFGMEPGRFIAAPSVELITNIINAYEGNLILDCSIYNAYMDTFLMNIRLPVKGESDHGYKYVLKGRSPDSLDIFRYKVFFENEKKIGDEIIFLNAGAYNFHTDFGFLPRLRTVIA